MLILINYSSYASSDCNANHSLNLENNVCNGTWPCFTRCQGTLGSAWSISLIKHTFDLMYFQSSGLTLRSIVWHVDIKLLCFMKLLICHICHFKIGYMWCFIHRKETLLIQSGKGMSYDRWWIFPLQPLITCVL